VKFRKCKLLPCAVSRTEHPVRSELSSSGNIFRLPFCLRWTSCITWPGTATSKGHFAQDHTGSPQQPADCSRLFSLPAFQWHIGRACPSKEFPRKSTSGTRRRRRDPRIIPYVLPEVGPNDAIEAFIFTRTKMPGIEALQSYHDEVFRSTYQSGE
jgi:hypothetical protein